MEYKYRVYGMDINSQIEITEFVNRYNDSYDDINKVVNIRVGDVPERFKLEMEKGTTIGFGDKEVWFEIENVGFYHIYNGTEIMVNIYDNADRIQVNNYLTCSCLGFIMLQKENVAIHGAVINIDNKGVIITGERGAGKSSLSTALRQRGYGFIADDVAALDIKEKPYINHAFPYQKLCSDLVDNMNYSKTKYKSFKSDTSIKYLVPVHDNFQKEQIYLDSIFKLRVDDVKEVSIKEIKGNEKLKLIFENIYRGEYRSFIGGFSGEYIKKCITIAKNIKVYEIVRPKDKFTLDKQIELVEECIKDKEKMVV